MLELRRTFCLPLLLTFATIQSSEAAVPLKFEDGNSVQLIDVRGELIEWPRQGGLYTMFNTAGYSQAGFSDSIILGGINELSEVYPPAPPAAPAPWPVIRPAGVNAWVRASDHLVQADTGQLFEIGSARKIFGRFQACPVPPAAIPFPSGVQVWTDFASSERLRLAISNEGELWAWESHTTNHPFAGWAPDRVNYGLIRDQFGSGFGVAASLGEGLTMVPILSPVPGEFFTRVMIVLNAPIYPAQGGAADPVPTKYPMLALLSDGELYEYGGRMVYRPETSPEHPIVREPIDQPVKLERPGEVSGWRDFALDLRRLYAISLEGELYGWSNNRVGQLGIGSTDQPPGPVKIEKPAGVNEWRRIELPSALPNFEATFALGDNGTLYGWGQLTAFRSVVPGESDLPATGSQYSMIKTAPTPLDLGSPENPVVDFKTGNGTLFVLLASGETITMHNPGSVFPANVTSHESELPAGTLHPLPNRPPFVRLVKPQFIGNWTGITDLTIFAEATDLDGSIESVTLLGNGAELGLMTQVDDAYRFDWSQIPRGLYELVVRATDDRGAVTDSTPVMLLVERNLPVIADVQRNHQGAFTFQVQGSEWVPALIEWSDNLKDWQPLQEVVLDSAGESSLVSDPAFRLKRFYRVVVDEQVAQP
jgi:hypothetical protein